MFSCVVAGRLPLPPPQQVDATHAVFLLEAAEQIQHIVVFMTGEQAFPEGYGATVHLMWPRGDGAAPQWQLLGCLLNTKPSAIFRLRDARREAPAPGPQTATLGLSIEPLDVIEREMQAIGKSAQAEPPQALALAARTQPDTLVQQAAQLAAPIAQQVFSYLSSFAPDSAPQAVPLLQRWLEQFQRKLQTQGVEFLLKPPA
ncbi:Similar to S.cerevisiae protein OPI10 (Protein with a possible role in phospholipid biosynthesis) [Malassezia sympodialis ATCC 42132]|uniref:Similar to S.cerevisiae protein OPI10 (Protein with a possible role in phospholipid biosynthesis) n=1 Tax=Malassezia sympodialis (strain ATCC 42132) TaxID=1230383 RepID=A0A1M8A9X6_MALS4|nr:Similar to S.cerevisiae protein OPI10 (Protein with a possible role in phospholipid biosynthesis) [Malassezia sympodialis ATCC 42132]